MWEDKFLLTSQGSFHTPKDVTCLISICNCVNIILKQNNENLVDSSNLLIGDPRGMQDACKI